MRGGGSGIERGGVGLGVIWSDCTLIDRGGVWRSRVVYDVHPQQLGLVDRGTDPRVTIVNAIDGDQRLTGGIS